MGTQQMPMIVSRPAVLLRLCGGIAAALATRSRRVGGTLHTWMERYRQRRAMAMLSDHMLKDLGLTRHEIWRESDKQFWKD